MVTEMAEGDRFEEVKEGHEQNPNVKLPAHRAGLRGKEISF
jgi:hypothetical protein